MKSIKFIIAALVLCLIVLAVFIFPVKKKQPKPMKLVPTLRVLVLQADQNNEEGLHRIEMPIDRERALIRSFAAENAMKLEYVTVPSFAMLFQWLKENKGDLISANVSETEQRKAQFLLSRPFDYTREVLFTSSRFSQLDCTLYAVSGKMGWVLPGTTYVDSMRALAFKKRFIMYKILPATISHDELIRYVADGRISYSVLNECDLDAWLAYDNSIRKLYVVRDKVPLVFAARKDSGELIAKLNNFIAQLQKPDPVPEPPPVAPEVKTKQTVQTEQKKTQPSAEREYKAQKSSIVYRPAASINPAGLSDLAKIKKRGYIRLLTNNNIFCCYLKKGRVVGFEYEMAKRFADSLKVSLITVIPKDFKDLTQYLREGKGDFIAANFTRNIDRIQANSDLIFCTPYHGTREVLVGRTNTKINSIGDLRGRKIFVRKGNSYYRTLVKLQEKGAKFTIVPVPESEGTLLIVKKVEAGTYDLTVADDTFFKFAQESGCKVKKLMDLTPIQPFSWIVRKNNPKLEQAIREFFRKENKSAFYNLCVKRYYSRDHAIQSMNWIKTNKGNMISPYDSLFRKYADLYNFNWYFLAAQAYQESHFQADLVNSIGATGLMQVMPKTAKELGISDLKKPENGIHAGVKYMAKVRKKIPDEVEPQDKLCFMLASYNAGYGHIIDARRLARKLGLNPNRWFNHTEKALALLEDPVYASQAKFGYCRASETIPYVRNIMLQGNHYQKLDAAQKEKVKINAELEKKKQKRVPGKTGKKK